MCGIAGIFHLETAKPVDPARVRAMLDVMPHRGPDGSGIWTAPGVGLGHLRLSIIDLGGGAQPMLTEDESLVVTFNGEIYNFAEVRAELEAKGTAIANGARSASAASTACSPSPCSMRAPSRSGWCATGWG